MNLLKNPITDSAEILKLIPQRAPMVMVDKMLYYNENKIISGFTITHTTIFEQNGFFSETGLIENMAQTAALFIGYKASLKNESVQEGYIGAIKNVTIEQLPKVNESIETEIERIHEAMGMMLVKGTIYVNKISIATFEMKTMLKQ